MARQTRFSMSAALLVAGLLVGVQPTNIGAAESDVSTENVHEPFNRRADLSLERLHFLEIVAKLRELFDVDIQIDTNALKEIGVELDKTKSLRAHQLQLNTLSETVLHELTRMGYTYERNSNIIQTIRDQSYPGITFQQKDVSLRSALRYILNDLGESITVIDRNGSLWITSEDVASKHHKTHVYGVIDVALSRPASRGTEGDEAHERGFDPATKWLPTDQLDYDLVIDLIENHVAPDSWDTVGGEGAIEPSTEGLLTVSQTGAAHEMIRSLLVALHNVRTENEKNPERTNPVPVSPSPETSRKERLIAEALKNDVTLEFASDSLQDVAESIAMQFGFPVRIDWRALTEAGITHYAEIDFPRQRLQLGSALETILTSFNSMLTVSIDHESLVITTREQAERQLKTVLYPVQDLVREYRVEPKAKPFDGQEDFNTLMENISSNVQPSSWNSVGGSAVIGAYKYGSALVVTQTDAGHSQVVQLLQQLRQELANQRNAGKSPTASEEGDEYATVVFLLWQPWDKSAIAKEADVVDLLRKKIDPESWNAKEVSVETLPSRLIITQRKSVQRKIYQLLEKLAVLKSAPAPQAAGPSKAGQPSGGFGGGSFGAAGSLPPAPK